MNDVRLLKTQKNDVFEMIKAIGLPALEFGWKDEKFEHGYPGGIAYCRGSALYHLESGFFYKFGQYSDSFSPGAPNRVQNYKISDRHNWWEQRSEPVMFWLARLKTELGAPDLWNEIVTDRNAYEISTAAIDPNERFSDKDVEYITAQLREISLQLHKNHQLTAAQSEAMDKCISEVVKAANSYGKKDWFNLATGLLINVAVASAFAPAAASDLYHSFLAAVAPLFAAATKLLSGL